MAHSEFKARALYNFAAEGPNELSFNANEILTITSNAAGNGWWYAKNAAGNFGVIPENYVQALADPPEPDEPPPPVSLSTFTNANNSYSNFDAFNTNNSQRLSTHSSNYQSSYDPHQYMNPSSYNNWQTADLPAHSSPSTINTTRQVSKADTDSDSFSDSEYPAHSSPSIPANTLANRSPFKTANTLTLNSTVNSQSRNSVASVEPGKAAPRARIFDKHGLENFLLNGCKAKIDEYVEITFNEREGGVCWLPNPGMRPFTCKVDDPSKGTKLGGLKAFIEYKIHPDIPGARVVGRRYKQFDWLHEQLVNKFRFICIPPLPGKQIAGRFEQDFIEERRRLLELWLNRICRHPVLCASYAVQHFVSCELSEKNKKDWKSGKRKIEKDEVREASWLQCVNLSSTGLSESQIISLIDTFAQQQPGLESQLKYLGQGLTKYLEKHSEVYERDIQRVSDLFSKVFSAVQVDALTPGNKELSSGIHKISGSYGGIAEAYKTKATEGLRDFIERIQEYIGLLICFPSILSIQRSANEFIKSGQQRATPDFSNAVHRCLVLNHVVLAEINFFQREKVRDFNQYLRAFVDEQIQFYETITSELRESATLLRKA